MSLVSQKIPLGDDTREVRVKVDGDRVCLFLIDAVGQVEAVTVKMAPQKERLAA